MSNVVANLLEVIRASRAQRQRIEYLYRCFPQELAAVLTQLELERGDLSKDEMLQFVEQKYRVGIPLYQRFFFNPTYAALLNICRRRLRLSTAADLFELEEQVWSEIDKRQKKGKSLGIRPGFFARRLRYDPGSLLEVLPLIHPLHQTVRGRVVIGVVGSPSAGKDAALKAIFGIETGNIMPIAGSTKDIEIYDYQERHDVLVVNTPGMGDVSQTVTQRAVEVLSNIDVYLYLLNSEGGLQAREYDDLNACIQTGKDVIVVLNKIDLIRDNKRDEFIQSVRSQLPDNIVVVPSCLDPIPGLMEPMGISEVRQWLSSVTERYVQTLGLPEAGSELKELFLLPTPNPAPQSFKEVEVTPLEGHEALDIHQMYATPKDTIRQHPILASIAGIWLFSIFVTPFIIIGCIFWLVYVLISGVVDFAFFAHETVVETTESVQESLEIPKVEIQNILEEVENRRITTSVDVVGKNIDSTTLNVEWFAVTDGGESTLVHKQEVVLEGLQLPKVFELMRGQVKRNQMVYVKMTPRNRLGKSGDGVKSLPIQIKNQPISDLTVNLQSNRTGVDPQLGDSLSCNYQVNDFDGVDDVQIQYQWFDGEGKELEHFSGVQTISTCSDPTLLTYTCRVTASDGESQKIAEDQVTINRLEATKAPLMMFVVKPLLSQMEQGKVGLDEVCQSEARKSHKPGTYVAWFADTTYSPFKDMVRSSTGYIDKKGNVLARDWCQLTYEGMQQPITKLTSSREEFDFFTRTTTDGVFDGSCRAQSCGCTSTDQVPYGDNSLTIPKKQSNNIPTGNWANINAPELELCDNLHVVCIQLPAD